MFEFREDYAIQNLKSQIQNSPAGRLRGETAGSAVGGSVDGRRYAHMPRYLLPGVYHFNLGLDRSPERIDYLSQCPDLMKSVLSLFDGIYVEEEFDLTSPVGDSQRDLALLIGVR